ncbi:MAG: hypothetical protein MUE41_11125, partial [Gemmatimonadaceae bacterium]|nr:hypothetical protein [Gemmatimonadaceae bacterium]
MPNRRANPNDPSPDPRPTDDPRVTPVPPGGATRPTPPGVAVAPKAPAIPANPALARAFLPSLDLVDDRDAKSFAALSDADKKQIVATKIADITHFRVGLATLKAHATVALDLAATVRVLPRQVRGIVVNRDGEPAERVSVQPAMPNNGPTLGRGVVTDELGVFTLPLPTLPDATRKVLLTDGLGLHIIGAGNQSARITVPVPAAGRQALGELRIDAILRPLPQSVIGALMDLIDDLPAVTPGPSLSAGTQSPVKVQIGQDACNILFEEDTTVRRFPFKMLVRLIEPRTTTVNQVFFPSVVGGAVAGTAVAIPNFNPALLAGLNLTNTRYVERLPVDKPISVDGFRDQLIGVRNNTIGRERTVPMAGTLGLGYVLNLAQVWKYEGLALGNLLYSLPLAPGEQQRIVVSERTATASVVDQERLDIAEQQHSSLREDASTQAVFASAFEEHVAASSHYRNEARSSSWGVAGGIGAVLGPVAIGIGAGGGGGKSSNNGSTRSALDGVRTYTSNAAEDMHRNVERQASARRSAQRTSIRLATETDRESVRSKVITNHNKAHALTMQYWEVLRKFSGTTEVEGCTLVCFIPLDLVRFLPPGQPLELTDTTVVDTRAELLVRYALLHRHADAIQPLLPGRHREGLRILADFAANPRATVNVAAPAANSVTFSLTGRWLPYERAWVHITLRSGRRIGPVNLDSPLTVVPSKQFGTRTDFLAELRRLRTEAAEVNMTGSIVLPESIDPSEIVSFEIRRAFHTIDYQLDPAKNPLYSALLALDSLPGFSVNLSTFESSVRMTPAELEQELGGPVVRVFTARVNGGLDNVAADPLATAVELPPSGLPIPAVERNPVLGFRDVMKIERTVQHVVRNTLVYSKAVWASLTPEERIVMLEGYTIGLPEGGLTPDGLTDPSQHVPLLNCIANQVLGYYGNCMVMPFSIPASLAVALNGDADDDDADTREPLTTAAVQEALTQFHKEAFSPPESHFTLPTRGVLGEAVLGHCPSAEKIDLTRFWNWQDSPADSVAEIQNVGLRANSLASLSAPSTLTGQPSIINNVAGEGGGSSLGSLVNALAGKAPSSADFSTDFLGQAVLTALGGKTIDSAESARKDALASATQLAGKALDAGVDVFKTKFAADAAKAAKAGET